MVWKRFLSTENFKSTKAGHQAWHYKSQVKENEVCEMASYVWKILKSHLSRKVQLGPRSWFRLLHLDFDLGT